MKEEFLSPNFLKLGQIWTIKGIMSSLIGAFAKNERLSLSKHSATRRACLFVPTLLVVSQPLKACTAGKILITRITSSGA